jgi:hypothetical protein
MLYFDIIPKELLEIIISKIEYKSFINLLSILNLLNLDYNHILRLKYPKLKVNESINISSYINILSKYTLNINGVNLIDLSDQEYQYFIFDTKYTYRLIYRLDELNDNLEGIENLDNDEPKDYIPKIIFIKDFDYLYINKDTTNEEKNILPSMREVLKIENGVICLKIPDGNYYSVEEILQRMNFCDWDNHIYKNGSFYSFSGLKVMYLAYDTADLQIQQAPIF